MKKIILWIDRLVLKTSLWIFPKHWKAWAVIFALGASTQALKLTSTQLLREMDITQPAHAQIAVQTIIEPVVYQKTIKEQVFDLLLENMSFDEAMDFMAVIRCESNFDPYAINKNKDGSFDLGIAQWNMKWNGEKITRGCAFNVDCAIKAMIDTYKKEGNLNKWVCAR